VGARHPTRGIVSPFFFLTDAPEAIFNEYGVPLKFAVNVPVSAFTKLPIARMLREARPKAKHWPGLILEVTEDQMINDLALASDVATELKELQCNLALDDFGAGYSSLARLRQRPFSELKIDRSYVMNCDSDPVNAGVCETIVEMGRRFGLKIVAEGIETLHESHKLQGIGAAGRPGLSVRQADAARRVDRADAAPARRRSAAAAARPRFFRYRSRALASVIPRRERSERTRNPYSAVGM
jgi:predicted signal transduction protein with EAL and GGDEF domain